MPLPARTIRTLNACADRLERQALGLRSASDLAEAERAALSLTSEAHAIRAALRALDQRKREAA